MVFHSLIDKKELDKERHVVIEEINKGIDKLLKRLNRIYFKIEVLKYTLPEEITRNKKKVPTQNLNNTIIRDFFVLGQENIIDFDPTFTKISCDSDGSFFDLYLTNFEPERYYRILISSSLDGSDVIVDNDNVFKVIKHG